MQADTGVTTALEFARISLLKFFGRNDQKKLVKFDPAFLGLIKPRPNELRQTIWVKTNKKKLTNKIGTKFLVQNDLMKPTRTHFGSKKLGQNKSKLRI